MLNTLQICYWPLPTLTSKFFKLNTIGVERVNSSYKVSLPASCELSELTSK